MNKVTHWMGRPIAEMSRDELIVALEEAAAIAGETASLRPGWMTAPGGGAIDVAANPELLRNEILDLPAQHLRTGKMPRYERDARMPAVRWRKLEDPDDPD